MPEITLKACPCCEGKADFFHCLTGVGFTAPTYHAVECLACGIRTRDYPTVEEAATAWNKRPPRRRKRSRATRQDVKTETNKSPLWSTGG